MLIPLNSYADVASGERRGYEGADDKAKGKGRGGAVSFGLGEPPPLLCLLPPISADAMVAEEMEEITAGGSKSYNFDSRNSSSDSRWRCGAGGNSRRKRNWRERDNTGQNNVVLSHLNDVVLLIVRQFHVIFPIEVEDYEDDMDANGDDVDDVDTNEDGVDNVDANEDMDDMDKVYNSGDDMAAIEVEYIKMFREDVIRAYREVCRVSSSSSSTCKQEAEAHSIDPLCPMAEVNILESQFGSAFDELNKDNNVET